MPKLPNMTKHRGFPSGLPGTGYQFTIRRANPKGVTPIVRRDARRGWGFASFGSPRSPSIVFSRFISSIVPFARFRHAITC